VLLNLVQQIQESMGVEQKLFDSINQQLAASNKESPEHKNLSTALCASQARLARLCARNMRCFMQVPAPLFFHDVHVNEHPVHYTK